MSRKWLVYRVFTLWQAFFDVRLMSVGRKNINLSGQRKNKGKINTDNAQTWVKRGMRNRPSVIAVGLFFDLAYIKFK